MNKRTTRVLLSSLPVAGLGLLVATAPTLLVVVLISAGALVLALHLWGTHKVAYGLLFLVFLLLPAVNHRVTPAITYSDVFLVVAGVLVLLPHKGARPMSEIVRTRAFIGTALMVASGLVASLLSPDLMESTATLFRLAASALLCIVVLMRWNPNVDEVRVILLAFFAVATVSALLGVFYLKVPTGRARGLTNHPNQLGLISAIAAGQAAILVCAWRRVWRLAMVIVFVVLTAGILDSGSRSAFLGLVPAVALAMTYLFRQGRGPIVIGAALFTALAIGGGIVGVANTPTVERLLGQDRFRGYSAARVSSEERRELLSANLDRAVNNPLLGSGLSPERRAHNAHLEVWIGLGLVGLLGWALVCWSSIRPGLLSAWAGRRLGQRDLMLFAASTGFASYAVAALFLNTLWNRYIWLTIGLVALLSSKAPGSLSRDDQASAAMRRPASVPPTSADSV